MAPTVAELSCRNVAFLCLAWRLRKRVVTLSAIRITISCRVERRQRVPVFDVHRLELSGGR
jgi:hypothetical protein